MLERPGQEECSIRHSFDTCPAANARRPIPGDYCRLRNGSGQRCLAGPAVLPARMPTDGLSRWRSMVRRVCAGRSQLNVKARVSRAAAQLGASGDAPPRHQARGPSGEPDLLVVLRPVSAAGIGHDPKAAARRLDLVQDYPDLHPSHRAGLHPRRHQPAGRCPGCHSRGTLRACHALMWPFSTEVNAMHPYVIELLARAHYQELERAAAAWRSAHPDGRTRQNRGRRRHGSARSARPGSARAAGIGAVLEPAASDRSQAPTLQDSLR